MIFKKKKKKKATALGSKRESVQNNSEQTQNEIQSDGGHRPSNRMYMVVDDSAILEENSKD